MSEQNTVYFYVFEHQTSRQFDLYNWPEWMGVIHGYEIDYIFGVPLNNSLYTDQERRLSIRMMDYWTNFAKSGNPNTDDEKYQPVDQPWPKYNLAKKHVVLETLGQNQAVNVRNGPIRQPKCEFWNQLISKWSVEMKALKENAARGCKCPRSSEPERLSSGGSSVTTSPSLCFVLLTIMTIIQKCWRTRTVEL